MRKGYARLTKATSIMHSTKFGSVANVLRRPSVYNSSVDLVRF